MFIHLEARNRLSALRIVPVRPSHGRLDAGSKSLDLSRNSSSRTDARATPSSRSHSKSGPRTPAMRVSSGAIPRSSSARSWAGRSANSAGGCAPGGAMRSRAAPPHRPSGRRASGDPLCRGVAERPCRRGHPGRRPDAPAVPAGPRRHPPRSLPVDRRAFNPPWRDGGIIEAGRGSAMAASASCSSVGTMISRRRPRCWVTLTSCFHAVRSGQAIRSLLPATQPKIKAV
jgi:hypothetical protein